MFMDGRAMRARRRGGLHVQQPDPNRLQILAMCAVIRMGWSDHERRVRHVMSEYRWQAPHCPRDLQRLLSERG